MKIIWFLVASLSMMVAVIGMFLPIMPTVPFVILAAFGYSKSSKRMHDWLYYRSVFAKDLQIWQEQGAIQKKYKWLASTSMLFSWGLSFLFAPVLWVPLVLGLVFVPTIFYIFTRPDAKQN